MENDSKINERQNENIQVYPPVKSSIDNSESKKFLHLFSKKTGNKIPSDKRDSNSNPKNAENNQEKEQKPINLEDELFLINKGIEQSQRKSKRTGDIKSALENFLRKSDLIEKIIKFFEENNREKTRQKKGGKNEIEEEKEKLTEIYINSIISRLADNVGIQMYKQNEFVVKMNEIGHDCYFLLSGILSVLKPVEYHIELNYDEYIQYLANLIKNKEFEIIDNIRRINQNYIDMGLVEDLENFVKSYFIIKLKKDITQLIKTHKFTKEFIQNRFKLFNLSFEDYNLNTLSINQHIEEIIKGSTVKEKDLKEYLDSIISPKPENLEILNSNPHIFENLKHKFTIFKYEDFLYLKPGSFFGESALDSNIHKRNASIRTEEDCIILSLNNDIYKSLLFENNKKLKSFDVVFICKNFCFNDISTIIFNKNYFPFFKLITKSKDDIIYRQSEHLTSIYFVKEGNIKLEINASITELYELIKYYYNKLSNSSYIKIGQAELKEIKENYLSDKRISDVRHQSQIMREKLNTKIKFELFTSSYCDTLGLEEYFLKDNYLCTATVITKDTKIFEIQSDSLSTIITNEKNCHNAYYNLIGSKLITLIKRLHTIKINYINQLNYKIKENFFGTEVPPDNLLKGQTGSKRPFRKYYKKKQDPKSLNYFYKTLENEEIKNQNFLSLQKATINLSISRNLNSSNNEMNFSPEKNKDNLTTEDLNSKSKSKLKSKKNKKKISINLGKYNIINELFKQNPKSNTIFGTIRKDKTKEKENEIKTENKISKRILETTIIKIGKDSLSLKEIGNRLRSSDSPKNSYLSIVKNFNRTTIYNYSKSLKFKDKSVNKTDNILSLKNHKNFFSQIDSTNNTENKLPRIPINRYNNKFENSKEKSKTYKQRIKDKKIVLKPLIISCKNKKYDEYFKNLVNKKKNEFNVILTDQNNLVFN